MKRRAWFYLTVVLAAVLVVAAYSFAAVPQTINYQGYLADSGGIPVNGSVQMQFKLYSSQSITVPPLWVETHQNVQVNQGRYSVVLGNGSPTPVPIDLPFDVPYYLGVTVGNDAEMTPRLPLTSIGYAFRAAQADSINSQTTITATNAIISTVSTGMAPLQVSSTTLVPNLNADMVGGMHATDFVAKTGDTMTGNLSLPSNGLRVGTNQLVVTGGNVGVGTTAGLMYKLDVAGDIRANGGWLRTTGTNGWLNENFGGGWFMNDSSWIRAYNDKNISTGGQMQAGTLRGNLVCIGNDCRTSWPAVNTISSTCTFPSGYAGWKPCYCPTGYSVTGQFGYGCEVHNILGISGCFQTYYDGTNAAQFYHDGSTAAYVGVWCVRTIP